MNSTSPSPRQRLIGLLGALWSRAQRGSTSPCPPDTHLAALFDGSLPPAQAAQVRRHIAHCPRCYRSLLHLAEVSDLLVEPSPIPLRPSRGLITLLGGVGVAAAAVLLTLTLQLGGPDWVRTMDAPYDALREAVVDGRYRPSATGWIWRKGYAARGLGLPDTARTRIARSALTKGVAQGLDTATDPLDERWASIRRDTPAPSLACEEVSARECRRIAQFHQAVGRWAVLMHFACEPLRSDEVPSAQGGRNVWMGEAFWQDAITTLEGIAERSARITPDEGYARLFQNWSARAVADEPATVCRGVPPLLSTLVL
ncbi:MAG: zf-HC2 domain-containing protein [Pseudomonadota bacterium]